MGITQNTLVKINNLILNKSIAIGKILEIGAQNLIGKFETDFINDELKLFDIQLSNEMYANNYYKHLGFEYYAIDYSGEDNCLKLDLNYEELPQEFKHQFDLVTNIGTTEHVLNQYNCFKVIHDATKVNGIMIHGLPMNCYFEHGFFNYQPNLFFSLALENDYEIVEFHVSQSSKVKNTYRNSDPDYINIMTINNYAEYANMGDLGIFIVLRKTKNQSFQVPQQNIYCEYKKKYYQDEADGLLNKIHELSLWGVDKNKLIAVFEDKKFLLYGAGGISENIISVKELRKNIVAIADIDKNKHGKYIGDIEIISPEKMVNFTNNILVTIDIDKDGITNYLKDIFESHVNIFFLNS